MTSSYIHLLCAVRVVWLGLREDERTETEGARAADRAREIHGYQHPGEPGEIRCSLQKAGDGGQVAGKLSSSRRGFGAGSLAAALYGCVHGRVVLIVCVRLYFTGFHTGGALGSPSLH